MTSRQIAAELKRHRPLIIARANSWHITTGVPFDEVEAEARLAFIRACHRWDKRKGIGISPYANRVIKSRLANFCRHYHRLTPPKDGVDELLRYVPTQEDVLQSFHEKVEGLSNEARLVVGLVLDSPGELVAWGAKGKLKRQLLDRGWSRKTIRITFQELKYAFA